MASQMKSRQSCRLPTSVATRCPLIAALPRPDIITHTAARFERRALSCRASASQSGGVGPARHAVLHDFCMCIPYGGISILAGIGLFFMNLPNIAGTALVAGATSLAASVLSLQEWKAGGDSKLYTLTSAASTAAVAYVTVTSLEALKGLPYWLSLLLCVLSVAASAFCAYNVLAGGNPPPAKKGAKGAASNGSSSS